MNDYYVYVYLDPRKFGTYAFGEYIFEYEPFYVGKGKNKRYLIHKCKSSMINDTNRLKINKILKINKSNLEPIIQIYTSGLDESSALNKEIDMIQKIGRIIDNSGTLTNISGGGEKPPSWTGKKLSDEHRKKISDANLGEKNASYGKKLSEEHRKKISDANKGDNAYWHNNEKTDEHKRKISETLKDKFSNMTSEERRNIYGHVMTEEQRLNHSKKMKGRFIGDKHPNSKYLYKFFTPDGVEHSVLNIVEFCNQHGMNWNTVKAYAYYKKQFFYKGWHIKIVSKHE